jgi:hypothetical protein
MEPCGTLDCTSRHVNTSTSTETLHFPKEIKGLLSLIRIQEVQNYIFYIASQDAMLY